MKTHHFRCPTCGKLCSVPWDAAWCTHHETTQPRPPAYLDMDWTRMLPITRVDSEDLPADADVWYVIEQRNNYGYPNNEIPGEDKRTWKVVAGPLSQADAYEYARVALRDIIDGRKVSDYTHYFTPLPADLVKL